MRPFADLGSLQWPARLEQPPSHRPNAPVPARSPPPRAAKLEGSSGPMHALLTRSDRTDSSARRLLVEGEVNAITLELSEPERRLRQHRAPACGGTQ